MERVCLIFLIMIQVGCATIQLEGAKSLPKEFDGEKRSFYAKTRISVDDEQFTLIGGLQPQDFYAIGEGPTQPEDNELNVVLPSCKMSKGFWENPYTLLTILGLTIGNIYECKTFIEVKDLKRGVVHSYETTTEYFGFTGLGAVIWGPFTGAILYSKKKNQVNSALYLYLKEKETLPLVKSPKSPEKD